MNIFFDTETTGVNSSTDRVVQIAWVVTDDHGYEHSRGNYIIKPEGFVIPQRASAIHGVTTERAQREGHRLADVLATFGRSTASAIRIVAHNAKFDVAMIDAECRRVGASWRSEKTEVVCTMLSSVEFCCLPNPSGRGGYKRPSLQELHSRLFGRSFEGAHDALADASACMRCYFELVRLGVLVTDESHPDPGVSSPLPTPRSDIPNDVRPGRQTHAQDGEPRRQVVQEVERGVIADESLWAEAFAKSDGDDGRTTATYIEWRSDILSGYRQPSANSVFYKRVMEELAAGRIDAALWSTAGQKSPPSDAAVEARYVLLRVDELKRRTDAGVSETHTDPSVDDLFEAGCRPIDCWCRYFAKAVDLAVALVIWEIGFALLLRASPPIAIELASTGWMGDWLGWSVTWVVVEVLSLTFSGTSVGRMAMGISIEALYPKVLADGRFMEVVQRTFSVYVRGLWCLLPVLVLFGCLSGYNQLRKHGITRWDDDLNLRVVYGSSGLGRIALASTFIVFAVPLLLTIISEGNVQFVRSLANARGGSF